MSNVAGIYGREREYKRNLFVFGYKVKEFGLAGVLQQILWVEGILDNKNEIRQS